MWACLRVGLMWQTVHMCWTADRTMSQRVKQLLDKREVSWSLVISYQLSVSVISLVFVYLCVFVYLLVSKRRLTMVSVWKRVSVSTFSYRLTDYLLQGLVVLATDICGDSTPVAMVTPWRQIRTDQTTNVGQVCLTSMPIHTQTETRKDMNGTSSGGVLWKLWGTPLKIWKSTWNQKPWLSTKNSVMLLQFIN